MPIAYEVDGTQYIAVQSVALPADNLTNLHAGLSPRFACGEG